MQEHRSSTDAGDGRGHTTANGASQTPAPDDSFRQPVWGQPHQEQHNIPVRKTTGVDDGRRRRKRALLWWTGVVVAAVIALIVFAFLIPLQSPAGSATAVDVLITEPGGRAAAELAVRKAKDADVRIYWSSRGVRRDTILRIADGNHADIMAGIFAGADAMSPEDAQVYLREIIGRGDSIRTDETIDRWSLVIAGRIPFTNDMLKKEQGLLTGEETNTLRNNLKLDVLFLLPAVPAHSRALTDSTTDTFIELLQNEHVTVQREIVR